MGVVCNVGWSAMHERRMTHIGDEVVMRDFGCAASVIQQVALEHALSLELFSVDVILGIVSAVFPTIAQPRVRNH